MRSIIISLMSVPDEQEPGQSGWDRQTVSPPTVRKRRLSSRELLAGCTEVIIEHAGQEYHLRHTRAGKLILTK